MKYGREMPGSGLTVNGKIRLVKALPVLTSLFLCVALFSFPSRPGFGVKTAPWGKHSLRVCFASPDQSALTNLDFILNEWDAVFSKPGALAVWDADLKKIMKSAINQEYRVERVGLEFVGWQDCPEQLTGIDVAIFLASDETSKKVTAQGCSTIRNKWEDNGTTGNRVASVWFENPKNYDDGLPDLKYVVSADNRFVMTVIHEFAHLAGLQHEDDRSLPNPKNRNRALYPGSSNSQLLGLDDAFIGEYDPNSITSYSYDWVLTFITGLDFTMNRHLPSFPRPTEELTTQNALASRNSHGEFPSGTFQMDDSTLFTIKRRWFGKNEYKVRIGLSQGDILAIRCLNRYYSADDQKKNCPDGIL